jgi:hypothetical protein
MSHRSVNTIAFPGQPRANGLILSHADHDLLTSTIGPYHGRDVERFLATAPTVANGRRLDTANPIIDDVLAALGCEVHGHVKLDEERDGHPRTKPKRGSTAEKLLVVYRQIERHLS